MSRVLFVVSFIVLAGCVGEANYVTEWVENCKIGARTVKSQNDLLRDTFMQEKHVDKGVTKMMNNMESNCQKVHDEFSGYCQEHVKKGPANEVMQKTNYTLCMQLKFGAMMAADQNAAHQARREKREAEMREREAQEQKEREEKAELARQRYQKSKEQKSILGFDLSLDYEAFKTKYADKIASCRSSNTLRARKSLPHYICFLKGDGQIDFAGLGDDPHYIRNFTVELDHKNILGEVFNEKFTEKTGLILDGGTTYESSTPFYQGMLRVRYQSKDVAGKYTPFVYSVTYNSFEGIDQLNEKWSEAENARKIEEMKKNSEDLEI